MCTLVYVCICMNMPSYAGADPGGGGGGGGGGGAPGARPP